MLLCTRFLFGIENLLKSDCADGYVIPVILKNVDLSTFKGEFYGM